MPGGRAFAAILDQDAVTLLEYREETAGFRLLETHRRAERFANPDAAAGALIEMLSGLGARNASVSVVLQHFGSFFHTLVLPPAAPEHVRQIIQREVQRSFNIPDAAIAYASGEPVERRDASRAGGETPRQVFIAGAPRSAVDSIHARLSRTRLRIEELTVAPEVFRRLYESLDGSRETTAMLVCLQNGPHVAFFVNGQLELAIEPPPALDGEGPLDTSLIVDQLERGAIFLRQQARGAVATRLLLAAPASEHDSLTSTIEARTGMHVAELGKGIGSPESLVAMGAVLAARAESRLDLYPHPPALDERLKSAMTGPSLATTTLLAAAAVAAFWAAMQMLTVQRDRKSLEEVQARVERALPAMATARQSVQGRERIASIRAALGYANAEKAAITTLMSDVAAGSEAGTQLDSLRVDRVREGMQTHIYGHASAASGPAAMSAAASFYRRFRQVSGLKDLKFESSYPPRTEAPAGAAEQLRFTISGVLPVESK